SRGCISSGWRIQLDAAPIGHRRCDEQGADRIDGSGDQRGLEALESDRLDLLRGPRQLRQRDRHAQRRVLE
ncbi:hypothetical protein FE65_14975, partial [Staphylococcus aureus]